MHLFAYSTQVVAVQRKKGLLLHSVPISSPLPCHAPYHEGIGGVHGGDRGRVGVIMASIELLYARLQGKLLLTKVPGLCIQVITVGPVVMEMVTNTAIDGRDSLHVATTPAPAKVTSLHLQRETESSYCVSG